MVDENTGVEGTPVEVDLAIPAGQVRHYRAVDAFSYFNTRSVGIACTTVAPHRHG